jgi:RNA polymerase sigma-70 factor (ECF subfamily)
MVLDGNDREVISACQRGDRDAFRALFETYQDRVYSIALRYSGDRAQALDIAQDVFVKLLKNIGDFRGEANFETWLYRLVLNRCLDDKRSARRWIAIVEEFFERATEPSALDDMLRGEVQERVQKAVAMLPSEQRVMVVLRYTEGLSYAEIAEIAGCSEGTVASRLNRAHKFLERRLNVERRLKRI